VFQHPHAVADRDESRVLPSGRCKLPVPFREYVSAFVSGDDTIPRKEKERLYKRFGYPCEEVGIGQLVEYFKQTPWQLGLCENENDIALLYRSLHAQSAVRIAQHLPHRISELSIEEGVIAGIVKDIADKKRRMSKKQLNHPAEFKLGDKRWAKKK